MKYISTRGLGPITQFEDVLLAGLAPDGGLYVPEIWPQLSSSDIAQFQDMPYAQAAASILALFTGDSFSKGRLREIASEVYAAFDHPETAPLTQVGEQDWILELYHGPTLAFKDFAMQMLGRLFDDVLARRERRLTIIAATSGDTGAAAIDALKDCKNVSIVVLHPEGRVTDVQRRMMTCVSNANVTNIAVDGSFDECQGIVKELFADREFSAKVNLSGVNSINWARIAAQTVYYFTAAAKVSQGEPVSFVVPTGNFGDIFAGYGAKCMGLPIAKLAVATNANDILHRVISTGEYAPSTVTPTLSPSMDIQVASNFERLLFDVMDRDAKALSQKMEQFKSTGAMMLNDREKSRIAGEFISFAASEEETLAEMERHYQVAGNLIDPHTAVARVAARGLRETGALSGKVITLSTAHPAKFPEAVKRATDIHPGLPKQYADLFELPEHMMKAKASADDIKAMIINLQTQAQ
ncbi:MAG: threonine synthase [Alphaproteobacteria bacterium]|nr:threonine synthase [Alphaproteobacteria bacterium]